MKFVMIVALGLVVGCAIEDPPEVTTSKTEELPQCTAGNTCKVSADCGAGSLCWAIGCHANMPNCEPVSHCMEQVAGLLCVSDGGCIPDWAQADVHSCS